MDRTALPETLDLCALRRALACDGFVHVPAVIDAASLAAIASRIDRAADGRSGWLDRFRLRRELSPEASMRRQVEIYRPVMLFPGLRQSVAWRVCRELAAQLGDCRHYVYDHAIYKLPGSDYATDWHQDLVYGAHHGDQSSLHFWVPLQRTTVEMGAMRYAVGSHLAPVLPHENTHKDRYGVDEARVRARYAVVEQTCEPGDVVIHRPTTLHGAGANRSSLTRKAWILHFSNQTLTKRALRYLAAGL